MNAKGSRKNPYSYSEYQFKQQSNNWHGGWVQYGDDIIYHSSTDVTYTGRCTKSYPVPYMFFLEMQNNGIWTGGWFYNSSNQKRYCDIHNTEYDSTLGSMSNPCSQIIYSEMISNVIWTGGWVVDNDGTARYIPEFQISINSGSGCGSGSGSGCGSGSGSGCGSGSGSGSGCGSGCGNNGGCGSGEDSNLDEIEDPKPIYAGSCMAGIINIANECVVGEVYLNWSEGNTVGHSEMSNAFVSIRFNDTSITITENNIQKEWTSEYTLSIGGYFKASINQNERIYFINGTFIVPMVHRK